jgi:hypothetical protein
MKKISVCTLFLSIVALTSCQKDVSKQDTSVEELQAKAKVESGYCPTVHVWHQITLVEGNPVVRINVDVLKGNPNGVVIVNAGIDFEPYDLGKNGSMHADYLATFSQMFSVTIYGGKIGKMKEACGIPYTFTVTAP